MIVAFFGHREIIHSEELSVKLETVIRNLIHDGADEFLLGGYGAFDVLAAKTVRKLKTDYPQIHSTLVLAYLNHDYDNDLYDETVYPPLEKVPMKYAITKRNEWIINKADIIVSYVEHGWGGAASARNFAKRKKKKIISINDFELTKESNQ